MSEPKDPAIKLFGKTIPLPDTSPETAGVCASSGGDDLDRKQDQLLPLSTSSPPDEEENSRDGGGKRHSDKESLGDKATENKQEVSEKEDDTNDKTSVLTSGESRSSEATSRANGDTKTSSTEKGTSIHKTSKTEEDQGETSNSQEKPLKKPSKILPCPRCNSMDTKFCYYNNYNVNQPRHFCKNCQRYWTAGGTMRNVPVGAGRRKNKNSASHYCHITVSEALQNARTDVPNGLHHHALKANGTVLTFGSDTPLCESMASVLNLADKTMRNCPQNGFQKPELRIAVPCRAVENAGELVNGASLPVANSDDEPIKPGSQDQLVKNCQSFPPQIQYFPGAPWSYPWNSAQWSSPMAPPAFCPPGFPMPFYPPAAFWGCTVPGAWNVPWLPQPSSPKQGGPSSGPNSPTLGKHSRDENTSKPNSSSEEAIKGSRVEKSLWIPKTLRIDDPEEAAKSSIWATLGIKNDKADAASGVGFKAFEPKADQKTKLPEASPVLQANPAAFSRSVNFHEGS